MGEPSEQVSNADRTKGQAESVHQIAPQKETAMTGLLNKLESLGAKIEELAIATGREVEAVYEDIVAHIEGKKAEAVAQTAEAPAAEGNAAEQPGEISTASTGSTSNTTDETATEASTPATASPEPTPTAQEAPGEAQAAPEPTPTPAESPTPPAAT